MKRDTPDRYEPSRCRFHPRRIAGVWSKMGANPGQCVCEECFQQARREYEREKA